MCFILAVLSLVIWWAPLASSFALALSDDQYTHILLILPASAALLFLDRASLNSKSLDSNSVETRTRIGSIVASILLATAVLATVVLRWKPPALSADVQLSLNMLAFVVWLIAAFVLCFGTRAFSRALFPLCFLFWLVPFPDFVVESIVGALQQGSAAAAHLLFALVRVPVEQQGILVHIPGLTIEVARECSSIRSSLMLIVTSMVLAQLLLRSAWRKTLVIAVAIPLSILKNGLRIFVIAMLATRVDPSYLTGRLHHQGGVVFFLIALGAMFLLIWIVRRGEVRGNEVGRGQGKPKIGASADA